jgi:hypothetical protein
MEAAMNKVIRSHIWQREEHEHYVEPSWCSARLFEEENFIGLIWDPCAGFGTIPEAAMAKGHLVYASDLVDRGYSGLNRQLDFLQWGDSGPWKGPWNIVCNPPFNIFREFAERALALIETQKVAMIMPVPRLNAARWLEDTPLKTIWLMTPRPSMPPGHVIASGEKPGGGKTDYCWLVWERDYSGDPSIKWLRRDTA